MGGVALRAETETETKSEGGGGFFGLPNLPAPDSRLVNDNAARGATRDQDRKGNIWADEEAPVRTTADEPINPVFFLILVFIVGIGSIIFFAQLTGTDDRFGGAIGDGSMS